MPKQLSLAQLLLFFVGIIYVQFTLSDPTDGYEVTQVHLAQGHTPHSMMVSWLTPSDAKSQVKFGTDPNNLDRMADSDETIQYTFNYTGFDYYTSGFIHHVRVVGLKPATTYYYKCGDVDKAMSGDLEFTTLPAVGDSGKISFAVIGDLGQTTDAAKTVEHIMGNNDLQMILHAGDLSYADCDQPRWDTYGELIEVLSNQRPWMVGPGNHEIEYNANDGNVYLAFEDRYKMPAIKPAEFGDVVIPPSINDATGEPWCASSVFMSEYNYGNSFYSFDVASVHVIYLNPYSTSNASSPQYQWLESDLEKVNREVTPWVVVVMHGPWYNSNTGHYEETQTVMMRDSMEGLFYKYKVNIAFAGHVHAYERTYPVFNNATVPDGTVFVTIGDGGNHEGHADTYYEQPEWSAYRNGTQFGHGEMVVEDRDRLVWRWMRNVDGEAISKDEVTICNTAFGGTATCD